MPILVGVYENEAQARHTLDKLLQAGFNEDQLGMVMRNGGLIPVHILDTLVSMGVPEEEATIYQSELDAGHIIVLVRHSGRLLEAFQSMFEITISGISVSRSQEPTETVRSSSSSIPAQEATSRKDETIGSDEAASLWQLMKNAGLDHLL